MRDLFLGLPSPYSTILSIFTVAINLALALATADLVFRGPIFYPSHELSFARVGHVSDNDARLLIREPNVQRFPLSLHYCASEVQEALADLTRCMTVPDEITLLSSETDYTGTFHLSKLEPDTYYRYATSNNHTGAFITSPKPGVGTKHNQGVFTFLTSSCIKPQFPYKPFHHPLSIPGLQHLKKLLPGFKASFMLFLGDFIYVDVPRRFGTDIETYRREYRMAYNSPDWPAVSKELPWIHVIDDHEIANDWDRNTTGVYRAAVEPWNHYHASVNPPEVRRGSSYFSFIHGPAAFFLLDTRQYRSPEHAAPANSSSKTMLGTQQLEDLISWLRQPMPAGVKWKFLVSSIPFTKNWHFGNQDTWAGYLAERQIILEAMWDVGLQSDAGVVVLSGDRHEFAATAFPPPEGGKWPVSCTAHEFSTSPLSQFYLPVRTYYQEDATDVMIKYLPDGNSKFGAVEISPPQDNGESLTKFRLFIDGKEIWSYTLTTGPSKRRE